MPNVIYERIGELIKQRRKRLKKTQEELAKEVHLSRGSLANIETGRQSILVHQLYVFARALDLRPFELLPDSIVDTPPANDLADKLPQNLSPQQKEQIARLISEAPSQPTAQRGERHAKPQS